MDKPDQSVEAFSPSVEHVVNLLERIKAGEHSLLPELRLALNDQPEIWKSFGDLGQHAKEAWLTLVAGSDLGLRECLRRKIADDERAIAGHDASRLESLMATRVVLTGLPGISHAGFDGPRGSKGRGIHSNRKSQQTGKTGPISAICPRSLCGRRYAVWRRLVQHALSTSPPTARFASQFELVPGADRTGTGCRTL